MSISAALVVLAVTWFMVLFIVLPVRLETQGDRGEVVPGTHAGAPADFKLGKRLKITTLIALPVAGVICAIIISGVIGVSDFDLLERFGPKGPITEGQ
ncbi:DUF1467 family protein [Vannielia litorea]|uniref:DUF1467 family protein n=1 Tax=Vannielia TaxID=2813041 RepID=UPI001C9878CA|nr:DUF1467 family protein [Vannielia litorea]MBY6048405.1 DUF1467 family protein [Vannielia litorea]MBY6075819.1 DUF1467 family protein [Vannielia litorea]MBY6151694.1 DUF1467 family protein [Vannielia litorea]